MKARREFQLCYGTSIRKWSVERKLVPREIMIPHTGSTNPDTFFFSHFLNVLLVVLLLIVKEQKEKKKEKSKKGLLGEVNEYNCCYWLQSSGSL